jgi:excisionase family DNA binding protein
VSVTVTVDVNGAAVPVTFNDQAIRAIAGAMPTTNAATLTVSPYMSVVEAAEYLRCSRQRIDDLLSQRKLRRVKDGRRTLISRSELEAYLATGERPSDVP